MPAGGSPRPDEPDLHLRFTTGDIVFDFRGCRTAVANFLDKWADSHHPDLSAAEVLDGLIPTRRMPCEELWLHP
ncbi:hypothetical protein [Nocardia sp. NPDC050710]|uniref:hypothetical protein n=1 Tax=Nocardia sp. NPDC050710 TaxID=3157220 RepID=UPI0033E456E5